LLALQVKTVRFNAINFISRNKYFVTCLKTNMGRMVEDETCKNGRK